MLIGTKRRPDTSFMLSEEVNYVHESRQMGVDGRVGMERCGRSRWINGRGRRAKGGGDRAASAHPPRHPGAGAARKALKEADHDFKGHREDAIKACDNAIVQLELCLKVDKK